MAVDAATAWELTSMDRMDRMVGDDRERRGLAAGNREDLGCALSASEPGDLWRDEYQIFRSYGADIPVDGAWPEGGRRADGAGGGGEAGGRDAVLCDEPGWVQRWRIRVLPAHYAEAWTEQSRHSVPVQEPVGGDGHPEGRAGGDSAPHQR